MADKTRTYIVHEMEGVLVAMHHAEEDRSRGNFAVGILKGADGKFYACTNGHFFRNGSFILVGHRYRFQVVDFRYATNIDLIDKEAGRQTLKKSTDDMDRR